MTGLRKEIARNVVLNILETLSDNDFVTILRVRFLFILQLLNPFINNLAQTPSIEVFRKLMLFSTYKCIFSN